MNKNKIIMKLKGLILAFLILFLWIIVCEAFSLFSSTSPPAPVVKWPFDVSKRDIKVNQEFRISKHRSYIFALKFDYLNNDDDVQRVHALVNGSEDIAVPIHLKIIKLDAGNALSKLIYKNTITTKGAYAWGSGDYLREIITIDLEPGIYRVEANTIEDRPKFSGTQSYLQITWYPSK